MKSISIFLLCLFLCGVRLSAQTFLRIKNHTNCDVNCLVQIADNTNLCNPPSYTWMNSVGTGTTTVLINNPLITPAPPAVPASFIRLTAWGILPAPPCSGCGVVQTSACSGAPQTNYVYLQGNCPGKTTMTWTDLGGGSAQVDIY